MKEFDNLKKKWGRRALNYQKTKAVADKMSIKIEIANKTCQFNRTI